MAGLSAQNVQANLGIEFSLPRWTFVMSEIPAALPSSLGSEDKFRCGTLVYTKMGLFTLFAWLLWGDFCFYLMETIWPNVLPLLLKNEGAPNFVVALVITAIPSAMNFVLNPIISTFSDRYRSRRGRRIPFLLFATPFVTLFLILLGFSRELGNWIHHLLSGPFPELAAGTVTITLISLLVICFRFFELFINTVFWYLFNDVVPIAFMGRFLGLFRVVGAIAGALFNFFLFRYSESHTSILFFGVAILYGSAFMMMSLKVKEGTYPEPDPVPEAKSKALSYVKTFFRESFSHRIYLLTYGYTTLFYTAGTIQIFMIFMAFSVGLTIDDVGKVAGIAALGSAVLMYPFGILVDRFHPLRIVLVAQAGFCLVAFCQLIFLFVEFPMPIAFWVYAGLAAFALPFNVANAAAGLPLAMRLFPHERFGQFCAANAMCGAVGIAIGGLLAGGFLDLMKLFFEKSNYYYRFAPLWSLTFIALSGYVTILVFREWKRLGGDKSYEPPPVSS